MWRKRQPKVAEVFDSELDSFGRFAEKRVEIRQLISLNVPPLASVLLE